MNMSDDGTFATSLCKLICPVCREATEDVIIMNSTLTKKYAQEVKEAHGKAIGYTEEPCDSCKKLMEEGVIIIAIDKDCTTDMSNPYRTGEMLAVKREAFKKDFPHKVIYMDQKELIEFGLLDSDGDEQ